MEKIRTDIKTLKKFGITMGIAFLIITLMIFFRHKHGILPALTLSASFIVLAYSFPQILKPLYIFWMWLAFALNWINTRLILCLVFYLCITPIGIFMKLLGKDLLSIKIDKTKQSYWLEKEITTRGLRDYERQF